MKSCTASMMGVLLWPWKLEIRFRIASPCRAPRRVKHIAIKTSKLKSWNKQKTTTGFRRRHRYFNTVHDSKHFAKFLIIESTNKEKPISSLLPFVIEKQIEASIGTPKSVKKLRNGTLLVETTRKAQTEKLLKLNKFFNLTVEVTTHKTLNSSKSIIRDRNLKARQTKTS